MRAKFTVLACTPTHVLIRDDANIHGTMSVTNDVEEVVRHLCKQFGSRDIYYVDTEGDTDQLLHKDGEFEGFRMGGPPP